MKSADFKDFISKVPTSVAVVSVENVKNNSELAVTVSSLNSVHASDKLCAVSFALKSNSYLGSFLKSGISITINYLSRDQAEIARKYSSFKNSSKLEYGNYNEIFDKNGIVKDCYLALRGTIHSSLSLDNSVIYVVKVIDVSHSDTNQEPLVYLNRQYNILDL